jgi:F0F1-type ATP synthase epsilon subunit
MGIFSKSTAAALQVIARAPFEVYYEGSAAVVSAANAVGQFDVLPGHADFFSMLIPCEVIIEVDGKDPVKFNITSGMLTVRDDKVLLFANM